MQKNEQDLPPLWTSDFNIRLQRQATAAGVEMETIYAEP